MMKRIWFMALAAIIAGSSLFARPIIVRSLFDTVPMDPSIIFGKLSNGFTYYLKNTNDPTLTTEIRFVTNAGFQHEEDGQMQVSHVIEHAAFGKTKNFENVRDYLVKRGLIVGTDFDANTGDVTKYRISLPAGKSGLLPDCINIIRDWCAEIILDSSTIELERKTVLAELGNPTESAENQQLSPYLQRIKKVQNFKQDALKRFYHDWYRPDLQTIIIVGNINLSDVKRKVEEKFGNLVMPSVVRKFSPPVQMLKQKPFWTATVDKSLMSLIFQRIYWTGKNHAKTYTATDYRNLLLIELYNLMAANRFNAIPCLDGSILLGVNHRYASKLESDLSPREENIGGLTSTVAFKQMPGRVITENIIRCILTEEERIARYGFTPEELSAAKQEIINKKFLLEDNDSKKIPERCLSHLTGKSAIPSMSLLEKNIPVWLNSISASDILAMQKKWRAERSSRIMLARDKKLLASIPDSSWIIRLEKDIASKPLEKFKSVETKSIMAAEEIAAMRQSKSVSTEYIKEINAKVIRLSNGITVILKPVSKDTPKYDILMSAFKRGGASQLKGPDYFAACRAFPTITTSGVGELDKSALDFSLRNTKTFAHVSIKDEYVLLTGETRKEGLELMLQTIYKRITAPRIDGLPLEQMKTLQLRHYPMMYDVIINEFKGVSIHNEDLYDQPESFSREKLLSFYSSFLSDMKGFTFMFSGTFNIDSVEQQIVKYIGALPSIPGKTNNFSLQHEKSNNTKNVTYQVSDQQPMKNEIILYHFGHQEVSLPTLVKRHVLKAMLEQVLYQQLREKMGDVYAVFVTDDQLSVNKSWLVIQFSAGHGHPDTLAAAAWHQIDKICKGDFNNVLFTTAVKQAIAAYNSDIHSADFWSSYFLRQELYNRPIGEITEYLSEIIKLTREDIAKFAAEYLKRERIKKITLN